MNEPYHGGPVEMNNDPMGLHAQISIPHLLQHLESEYKLYLQQQIHKRRQSGPPPLDLDEAMRKAPYHSFMSFCSRYLSEHRPVEQFALDYNVGVRLSNNVRVALCPYTDARGTMQDSGSVAVTQGRSQPGMGGVIDGGGLSI